MQISVIIPTFNRAPLLKRALQSVYLQSLPPDEVIVVDDGSTDATQQLIANEFQAVKYIKQAQAGVSSARNRGISAADFEWIALLDSDDEWQTNKLMLQVEALNAQQGYKICHTDEIWIRNGRRVNPMKKHTKQGGWIFQGCLPLCAISPSSVLIHRDLFEEVGLFDESMPACEDYDLWLRITAHHPVLYLEEKLVKKYGGHEDQLSKKYWGMDRYRVQALEKIFNSNNLNSADTRAVLKMLNEKINILLTGAKKHNNEELVSCYSAKKHHYARLLERLTS